jgi:hypothetical protein
MGSYSLGEWEEKRGRYKVGRRKGGKREEGRG